MRMGCPVESLIGETYAIVSLRREFLSIRARQTPILDLAAPRPRI
jgi:hypothetical protein